MKVLSVSSLFPNKANPRHGIFVKNRLQKLKQLQNIDVEVLSPVPKVPLSSYIGNRYQDNAVIPEHDAVEGIQVHYPRYIHAPLIGMHVQPYFMFKALYNFVRQNPSCLDGVKVIDAHYAYPDGVAATLLARKLKLPVTVTLRGSDINVLPSYYFPKKWLKWAFKYVDAIIAVSRPLAEKAGELAPDAEDKIYVVQNGVDDAVFSQQGEVFQPEFSNENGKLIVSVGNLIPLKGHNLVVEAIANKPDINLLIIGKGAMQKELENQIDQLGISSRVKIINNLPQVDLAKIYRKADLLVLASENEGCPNVLLEAQACGTPVISTNVGAAKDLMLQEVTGLLTGRTPEQIKEKIEQAFQQKLMVDVQAFSQEHSWQPKTEAITKIFDRIGGQGAR